MYRLNSKSLAVLVLAATSLAVDVAAAGPIDGAWEGSLNASGVMTRIVFNFSTGDDGALHATLDIPDQGAYGISVDSVALTNDDVRCEVKRINGLFEGKLNTATRKLDGFWTQFGQPMTLTLEFKPPVARKRPQEPKPPFSYAADEVSFKNVAAGITFAGTFTHPAKGKKLPAVVLIGGSGWQDRDAKIFEHKPFLLLADYLTKRGVAVLRFDDRSVGGTTAGTGQATSDDFAQDVSAAIAYLQSRRDVDPKHIGLIGHSEGGIIAPLVASRSKDVAFVVMLAGSGVRGREVLVKQNEMTMRARNVPEMVWATNARLQQRMFDIVMKSTDDASAMAGFDAWWKETSVLFANSGVAGDALEGLAEQLRSQVKSIASPWMRFFLSYDPAPTLAKLQIPVLALNGTLDLQVSAAQNLPAIEAALKAGGNKDYSVQELAGLNHLFQAATTGLTAEYIVIEETMNPKALDAMGDWIAKHTGQKYR